VREGRRGRGIAGRGLDERDGRAGGERGWKREGKGRTGMSRGEKRGKDLMFFVRAISCDIFLK